MGSLSYFRTGALTETGATIAVATSDAAAVRVGYSTDSGLAAPTWTAPATPDANGMVMTTLTGLTPNTVYYLAVEVDGVVSTSTGRFKTAPSGAASFQLAFGACQVTEQDTKVFDAIKARHPLLFAHIGDFHYLDITTNDPALFRAGIAGNITEPSMSAFAREVPMAYVFDDHDYGGDNSDGTNPAHDAACTAYRQVVPSYPLVHATAIYQAWTLGRVRCIMPDLRSEADPDADTDGPTKSLLGATQKTWLKQQLTDAATDPDIKLVVLLSSRVWLTDVNYTIDAWGDFRYERQEIADHIASLPGLDAKLVIVWGDAHATGMDDGSHNDYSASGGARFPCFGCAPLNQVPDNSTATRGGPFSEGVQFVRYVYGVLDITDTGGDTVAVTMTAYQVDNSTGAESVLMSLDFDTAPDSDAATTFETTALRYWDGMVWRDCQLNTWDGGAWRETALTSGSR